MQLTKHDIEQLAHITATDIEIYMLDCECAEPKCKLERTSDGGYKLPRNQTLKTFATLVAKHNECTINELPSTSSAATYAYVSCIPQVCIGTITDAIVEFTKQLPAFFNLYTRKLEQPPSEFYDWLEFHATADFDSFESACDLLNGTLDSYVARPFKKLHEDITALAKLINTPTQQTNKTWDELKFNDAERSVMATLLHCPELWNVKTTQLLALRCFLYERTTETIRSSAITEEFNKWLATNGINQTVMEVGTLLKLLGYTSKRVTAGVNWIDLTDKSKIIGISVLRNTDLFRGTAPLCNFL